MARVAINGFGRIGRCFYRAAHMAGALGEGADKMEVVAVNDLTSVENLAYLLTYDSVYGRVPFEVGSAQKGESGMLVADGKEIPVFAEKDPAKLPWKDMGVDIVVEATGIFTSGEKAKAHLDAGAKRVVITAPAKGDDVDTILIGANEEKFESAGPITSNASCTTNAASPLVGILDEAIGIERALLNTTHAYTATQSVVDGPASSDDFRRGRAAAMNLVPASTGAAKATALAHPALKDKFDGIAIRIPVIAGSIADVTFVAKRETSVDEVNEILKRAAESERWKDVLSVSEEQLVSSDIVGSPFGSIADLTMTRVADGTLVKVLAWYDNEMGYCRTLVKHVTEVSRHIR